jgi:hypothetical protein
VLGQILTRQPDPPSQHRPGLDWRLEAVCLQALSKEVADRYAGMRDLRAALADCLRRDRLPAPPQRPGRGARPRPIWSRRQLIGLGLAAVAATAVGLLAGHLLRSPPALGTIRIHLDGPRAGVEVRVDGEPVESAGVDEPLRLPPGRHHLLVTGKKVRPVSTSFTVARGDNPALRVPLVPRGDDAHRRGHHHKREREREREDEDEEDDD